MTLDEFNRCCGSLPGTNCVRQWGDAHVWKVGDKVFALISHWGESEGEGEEQELGDHTGTAHDDGVPSHISFKCSDLTFEMLCQERGISPAPYLGRYKWAQLVAGHPLTNDDVQAYIKASYYMVAVKLTKAKRKEIGLI
ncbi:MAG: MmcQ/YjbR family DNA-binding protein [Pseudomonadota bacterium]